jgi:DNA-binding transcriptional ArsR family regulator
MRVIHHPHRGAVPLTTVLYALSDPMRLRIVRTLDEHGGELACNEFRLPLAKATMSHHFKVLREAGITACRAEGTARLTSLRREDLDGRFPGLLDAVLGAVRAARRI